MGMTMDVLPLFIYEEGVKYFVLDSVNVLDPSLSKRLRAAKPKPKTQVRITPKVGRNDLCPCGSGKKFKKCCDN